MEFFLASCEYFYKFHASGRIEMPPEKIREIAGKNATFSEATEART
jgi:hypothetical protein